MGKNVRSAKAVSQAIQREEKELRQGKRSSPNPRAVKWHQSNKHFCCKRAWGTALHSGGHQAKEKLILKRFCVLASLQKHRKTTYKQLDLVTSLKEVEAYGSTNHTMVRRWVFRVRPGLGEIVSSTIVWKSLHHLPQMKRVLLQQCNKTGWVWVGTCEQCNSGPQIHRLYHAKRPSHDWIHFFSAWILQVTLPGILLLLINLNSTNPPQASFSGVMQMSF